MAGNNTFRVPTFRWWSAMLAAALLATALVVAVDSPDNQAFAQVDDGTGEITGVVVDAVFGGPVVGATVRAQFGAGAGPGDNNGEATTDDGGAFSITGLALTDFQVVVIPPAGSGLATEYYQDQYYPGQDTLVTATAPGTALGLSITLDQAATINGTVTNSSGSPVAGIDIFATEWLSNGGGGWVGDGPVTTTSFDGTYTAQVPPSGYYGICAAIFDPDTGTNTEICNPPGFDPSNGPESTPQTDGILLTEGSTTTVDLQFDNIEPGTGDLGGVVVDARFGGPVDGATVRVFAPSVDGLAGNFSGETTTDDGGAFNIAGLALTDFQVIVIPPAGSGLATEYYQDQYFPGQDTLVTAGTGFGLSITLDEVATVTGTVTGVSGNPLPGVAVVASEYLDFIGGWVGDGPVATSGFDGTFTGQAPPSGYYAFCATITNFDGSLATVCNPAGFDQATTPETDGVLLTEGSTRTVDLQFDTVEPGSGEIIGVVEDTAGNPVAGAFVRVDSFGAVGPGNANGTAVTDASGAFAIIGLSLTDFQVTVTPPSGSGLATEYYEDLYYPIGITPVAATAPGTGATITIELDAAATITGTVTDADGSPLGGINIFATEWLDFVGGWVGDGPVTTTNADGTYTAQVPPSGYYGICAAIFDPDTGTNTEACNPPGFDPSNGPESTPQTDGILLTEGTVATVNLRFGDPDPDAGEITGTVTLTDGSAVEGATVQVNAFGPVVVPGDTNGETVTDAAGSFTIGNLALADFQVIVIPPAGSGLATEYYDNNYYPGLDTPVTATTPGTGDSITVELDPLATITGTVTDASGNPVDGINIFATEFLANGGGIWIGDGPVAATDSAGAYTAQIPPSGYYAICAAVFDPDTGTNAEVCNPAGFDPTATSETDGVLITPGSINTIDLQFGATDDDGIADDIENGAPNDGDGNDDGVADSAQANVASFIGSDGYITLESPSGTTLKNVAALAVEDVPTSTPPGAAFPDGLISFEVDVAVPGAEADVTIYSANTAGVTGYTKFIDGAWLTLPGDKVQVFSDRVVITLQDGGLGDVGPVDGTIVDPGGISVTSAFRGFFGPIREDRINKIKSGRRVNLLFKVSQGGVRVTDPSLLELSVSVIPCNSTDPADATLTQVLATAGRQGLHAHGPFLHARPVLRGDAGTCRLVTAAMLDGSGELSAVFKFMPRRTHRYWNCRWR